MSDNRTTELLKDYAFALRRFEYDADKPGSNMTLGEYEAEEKKITDEYSQAIAATLGGGEFSSRAERTCRNEWAEFGKFRCSECWTQVDAISTNTMQSMSIKHCPNCGAKVVDA